MFDVYASKLIVTVWPLSLK